jgi:hypothetical protein
VDNGRVAPKGAPDAAHLKRFRRAGGFQLFCSVAFAAISVKGQYYSDQEKFERLPARDPVRN